MITRIVAVLVTASAAVVIPAPAVAAAAAPSDLCAQVDHAAGFTGDALITAVGVALAESGCNPGARHVNGLAADAAGTAAVRPTSCTRSIDRGLHQINNCAHPDVPDDCAYDAQCNADVAYTLSAAGTDWTAWAAFTNGSYRAFLPEARAAVQRLGIAERPVCLPVTGDWDANGTTTMGLACKPDEGQELRWELINVNSGGSPQIHGHFGSYGCVPVTGDWDGDGATTVGVACRTAQGRIAWALSNGFAGGVNYSFTYGSADLCHPVTGDWDGDGRHSVGIACRTTRSIEIRWSLINSLGGGSPSYEPFGFGSTSCRPVTGDWNDDHTTTIGQACSGTQLTWSLMNIHRGGSPAVRTNFGTGRSYSATTGWGGPNWPRWPTA